MAQSVKYSSQSGFNPPYKKDWNGDVLCGGVKVGECRQPSSMSESQAGRDPDLEHQGRLK